MPVIVGALGIIKKGADKLISNIPEFLSLHEIQKKALCGTAHLLRRFGLVGFNVGYLMPNLFLYK